MIRFELFSQRKKDQMNNVQRYTNLYAVVERLLIHALKMMRGFHSLLGSYHEN